MARAVTVTTARPSPSLGCAVRCLGWEDLDTPFHLLHTSVSATLEALGVPFTRPEAALPPPGPAVFVAQPHQPLLDDHDDCAELRVTIQVLPSEQQPGKNSVTLRRTQGGHWRFRAFYAAFRLEFAKRIGMPSVTQLSAYSPMLPKRAAPPAAPLPCVGWGLSGRSPPSPARSPMSRARLAATAAAVSTAPATIDVDAPSPTGYARRVDACAAGSDVASSSDSGLGCDAADVDMTDEPRAPPPPPSLLPEGGRWGAPSGLRRSGHALPSVVAAADTSAQWRAFGDRGGT